MMQPRLPGVLALGLVALLGIACGDKDGEQVAAGDPVAAGLVLEDVNATSATFLEQIELGPQGGAATAWYFTHAT